MPSRTAVVIDRGDPTVTAPAPTALDRLIAVGVALELLGLLVLGLVAPIASLFRGPA